MKLLKFASKVLKIAQKAVFYDYIPDYIRNMDFVYLATDFENNQICNRATSSDIGPYLAQGTITKNGSEEECYLSNGLSNDNFLYLTLTNDQLNRMKATDSTYTFFFRVVQTTNGTGGIFSWRYPNTDNYNYMIRSYNTNLQLHFNSAINTNLSLTDSGTVYKVVVNGTSYSAKDLVNGYTWSTTNYNTKHMGNTLTTFQAGYPIDAEEGVLDKVYALAGIARATTEDEDSKICEYLLNQGYNTIKYKRFMWKWTTVSDWQGIMQMTGIKINNIDTFTYVAASLGGFTDQGPEMLLDGDSETKWCTSNARNGGWIIFDSANAIVPTSYALQTGGDTAQYSGRNPTGLYLYASTGTPTTDSDASWELLNNFTGTLPAENLVWYTVWQA